MRQFLAYLYLYDAIAAATVGSRILWLIFSNRPTGLTQQQDELISALGPRIIALALAKTSAIGQRIPSNQDFAEFCRRFLNIDQVTTKREFIDHQAALLADGLQSSGVIPKKYVEIRYIEGAASIAAIFARIGANQFRDQGPIYYDLIRGWAVFDDVDGQSSNDFDARCVRVFGLPLVELMRASFAALALAASELGWFSCHGGTDERILADWNINVANVDLAASKLSIETDGFNAWLTDHVLTQPNEFQPYCDDPISDHGLVAQSDGRQHQYMLAAPRLYVRGVLTNVLSNISANYNADRDRIKDVFVATGDALHRHVEGALRQIFGARFEPIATDQNNRTADYLLKLPDLNVVIELKRQLGSRRSRSILTPEELKQLYEASYDPLLQLASSISSVRGSSTKPTMGLIMVGDGTAIEAVPFLSFARASGMLQDLGVECVEVTSWSSFERTLSQTSLKYLSRGLLARTAEGNRNGFLLSTQRFARSKSSALHSYEYLKDSERKLLGFLADAPDRPLRTLG